MIAACVLAAGASSRYGSLKQLEESDGEPWVRRTARLAVEAGCAPVLVITGAEAERVATAVAGMQGVRVVEHPGWESGMGGSIAAAARELGEDAGCDGVLLLACDQPSLDAAILRRLLAAFEGRSSRVGCGYAGTVGIPALFGRHWFERLAALDGDRGAKPLLVEGPQPPAVVDWPAGVADCDERRDPER